MKRYYNHEFRESYENKLYSPTEEDIAFESKYGEDIVHIWRWLDDAIKEEYEELKKYYQIFATLYTEHYEDLKLYALMYRNVPLYHCANDAFSVLFFASKKDEIIGYKNKLYADRRADKARIVILYSKNEVLFPKVCIKYANVNFQPNRNIFDKSSTKPGTLQKFKNNDIPHVYSVNDLSESECQKILAHTDTLEEEYQNLCDQYLGDISDLCFCAKYKDSDKLEFCKSYFIPKFESNDSKEMKYVIEFLENKIGSNNVKKEIEALQNQIQKKINLLEQKVNELSDKLESLDKSYQDTYKDTFNPYAYSHVNYDRSIFRIKYEIENVNKMHMAFIAQQAFGYPTSLDYLLFERQLKNWNEETYKQKVETLKQQLKHLEEEKKKWEEEKREWKKAESNRIMKRRDEIIAEQKSVDAEIKSLLQTIEGNWAKIIQDSYRYETFITLYNNKEEVDQHINHIVEKRYNALWLENPKKMHEFESCCIMYKIAQPSIFELLFRANNWPPPSRVRLQNLEDANKKLIYHRTIALDKLPMRAWCETIDKERKEKERIEQEKRERERKIEAEKKRIEEERKRKEEEVRREKLRYNQRNKHYRDANISFDKDKHIYTVKDRVLESVSTLVSNFFPKFNPEDHAKTTAEKRGMTVEEVLEMWRQKGKESRELGTLLHEKIEKYYQGIDSPDDSSFSLFKMFAERVELQPYRTEWSVYDYDLGIAGSIDFVDYQNGEYTIYDWKRSDKIIVNGIPAKIDPYGDKGNYPLRHLDNSPYYHYALQLSLYKYILEKNYGIQITHLRLGIFHPSYTKYYVLEMPYLEKEVKDIFKLRSEIVF